MSSLTMDLAVCAEVFFCWLCWCRWCFMFCMMMIFVCILVFLYHLLIRMYCLAIHLVVASMCSKFWSSRLFYRCCRCGFRCLTGDWLLWFAIVIILKSVGVGFQLAARPLWASSSNHNARSCSCGCIIPAGPTQWLCWFVCLITIACALSGHVCLFALFFS